MAGNPCAKPRGDPGGEEFAKRILILSEGGADCEFFQKLVQIRALNDCQVLRPADGKNFGNRLKSIRSIADPSSTIVLVTDSDDDPAASFADIQHQLQEVGDYGVPPAPLQAAPSPGFPTVVVMLLPKATTPGSLETLLLGPLSAAYAPQRAAVEQFLAGRMAGWSAAKQSKARVACMIASICQDDPSCSVSSMWYEARGFQPLLHHNGFDELAAFLGGL